MSVLSAIGKRIERHRGGGVEGPDPTGFLLSESEAGNVLLVVHDLSISEGVPLNIVVGDRSVRIVQGERIVLQARDENGVARSALESAGRIQVLETSAARPLRLHDARLAG